MIFRAEDQSQLQLVERQDIDDEDDLFEVIDKLIAQGINAGDVKKLQDAGIYTCNGLMMHTKKEQALIRICWPVVTIDMDVCQGRTGRSGYRFKNPTK
ncbi:meiotic recombination protein DMC1 homolog [Rosa rugosa]|uniref:meiotic recombination protein DMC1 homolog n=1 Tax=Rosa rugosa TaxID=74645 RepID=UPI002B402641|nr:meiotic recombination protein DMC1 homolog [Rosa rugosa]